MSDPSSSSTPKKPKSIRDRKLKLQSGDDGSQQQSSEISEIPVREVGASPNPTRGTGLQSPSGSSTSLNSKTSVSSEKGTVAKSSPVVPKLSQVGGSSGLAPPTLLGASVKNDNSNSGGVPAPSSSPPPKRPSSPITVRQRPAMPLITESGVSDSLGFGSPKAGRKKSHSKSITLAPLPTGNPLVGTPPTSLQSASLEEDPTYLGTSPIMGSGTMSAQPTPTTITTSTGSPNAHSSILSTSPLAFSSLMSQSPRSKRFNDLTTFKSIHWQAAVQADPALAYIPTRVYIMSEDNYILYQQHISTVQQQQNNGQIISPTPHISSSSDTSLLTSSSCTVVTSPQSTSSSSSSPSNSLLTSMIPNASSIPPASLPQLNLIPLNIGRQWNLETLLLVAGERLLMPEGAQSVYLKSKMARVASLYDLREDDELVISSSLHLEAFHDEKRLTSLKKKSEKTEKSSTPNPSSNNNSNSNINGAVGNTYSDSILANSSRSSSLGMSSSRSRLGSSGAILSTQYLYTPHKDNKTSSVGILQENSSEPDSARSNTSSGSTRDQRSIPLLNHETKSKSSIDGIASARSTPRITDIKSSSTSDLRSVESTTPMSPQTPATGSTVFSAASPTSTSGLATPRSTLYLDISNFNNATSSFIPPSPRHTYASVPGTPGRVTPNNLNSSSSGSAVTSSSTSKKRSKVVVESGSPDSPRFDSSSGSPMSAYLGHSSGSAEFSSTTTTTIAHGPLHSSTSSISSPRAPREKTSKSTKQSSALSSSPPTPSTTTTIQSGSAPNTTIWSNGGAASPGTPSRKKKSPRVMDITIGTKDSVPPSDSVSLLKPKKSSLKTSISAASVSSQQSQNNNVNFSSFYAESTTPRVVMFSKPFVSGLPLERRRLIRRESDSFAHVMHLENFKVNAVAAIREHDPLINVEPNHPSVVRIGDTSKRRKTFNIETMYFELSRRRSVPDVWLHAVRTRRWKSFCQFNTLESLADFSTLYGQDITANDDELNQFNRASESDDSQGFATLENARQNTSNRSIPYQSTSHINTNANTNNGNNNSMINNNQNNSQNDGDSTDEETGSDHDGTNDDWAFHPLMMSDEEVQMRMTEEERQDLDQFLVENDELQSGTWRALLRHLTWNYPPDDSILYFLFTYDMYEDHLNILKTLLLLFRAPGSESAAEPVALAAAGIQPNYSNNGGSNNNSSSQGTSSTAAMILNQSAMSAATNASMRLILQHRICNLIGQWINWRYDSLSLKSNQDWQNLFNDFCVFLTASPESKHQSASNKLQAAWKEARSHRRFLKHSRDLVRPGARNLLGAFATIKESGVISKLTDATPLEWAHYLTVMDADLFARVKLREYRVNHFSKLNQPNLWPNLNKFVEFSNKVSSFVSYTILMAGGGPVSSSSSSSGNAANSLSASSASVSSGIGGSGTSSVGGNNVGGVSAADVDNSNAAAKSRAAVINYFVRIMDELRQIRSYNSVSAIYGALKSLPIGRLEKTWSYVGKEEKEILARVDELFDRNYKQYRSELNFITKPLIPIQQVVLRDLIHIDEMQEQTLQEGWLDFSKIKLMGKAYKMLVGFQMTAYDIMKIKTGLHEHVKAHQTKSWDTLLALSQSVELSQNDLDKQARLEAERRDLERKNRRFGELQVKYADPSKVPSKSNLAAMFADIVNVEQMFPQPDVLAAFWAHLEHEYSESSALIYYKTMLQLGWKTFNFTDTSEANQARIFDVCKRLYDSFLSGSSKDPISLNNPKARPTVYRVVYPADGKPVVPIPASTLDAVNTEIQNRLSTLLSQFKASLSSGK